MGMSNTDALRKAIEIVGGQTELARRIGGSVKQQHIHSWLKRSYIPPDRVLAIEAATDRAVTRHELRPDLYPAEEQAA